MWLREKNIGAFKNVSELTALACGGNYVVPGKRAILDIGGQDTKLIIQSGGKLKGFFVNDKCAAGCGMFLANTLNLLKRDFGNIDLGNVKEPSVKLSSVCAVFAQSEIVRLLSEDYPPEIIVQAVIWQILQQAGNLLTKADSMEIVLAGGLAQLKGIGQYAENIFQQKVIIPQHGKYLSAIGCAMLAQEI